MPLTIQNFSAVVRVNGVTSSNPSEVSKTQDRIACNLTTPFPVGDQAGQVNMVWSDRRTILAGANDDIVLLGSLTDAYGQTVNFASIKHLLVLNHSQNPATVIVVGNTGVNWPPTPWQSQCGPGDPFLWQEKQGGIAVVASTADTLRITNTDGSNAATYDIVLAGVAV